MKVFVVIPCFNEAGRVLKVLGGVSKYCKNIVVVDDGSVDGTKALLDLRTVIDSNILVLSNENNFGKSFALLKGCHAAIMKGADMIITMDADGQHEPCLIPVFIQEIKDGMDIVFGSRPRNENMPFVRRFGNCIISGTLKLLFGLKVSDALSGFKAFTRSAFHKIKWGAEGGYLVESNIFINVAKNGLKYSEIEIPTVYVGKSGITKMDGLRILFNVLKRRLFG